MTVQNLIPLLQPRVLALPNPEREIDGCYIGDLLSWVMGRAGADSVWITIMSNINVCAVASLADCSCVLLAEDVVPDDEVIAVAKEKGINLLSCKEPAYTIACLLHDAGI